MNKTMLKLLLALLIVLIAASESFANVGLPMISIYLPPAWLALIPIIIIEAIVGTRAFNIPFSDSFRASGIANILTTILGLPLLWLIIVIAGGLIAYIDNNVAYIISLAITFPFWMPPIDKSFSWLILSSTVILMVIFFFISVWIEYLINKKILKNHDPSIIKSWMWKANALSYIFLSSITIIAVHYETDFGWLWKIFRPIVDFFIDAAFKASEFIK
jgi:hypothetical protein